MNATLDISVLLASDIPMLRGSVVDLLNDAQSVSVVACAESHGEVLPLAEVHRPQLALLDLDINRENLADLTSKLTQQNTSVLLMSDEDDISQLYELFVSGLRGVLHRRTSAELVCRSVRAVASGELWLSRQMAWNLVEHLRTLSAVKTPLVANVPVLQPAATPLMDRRTGLPANRYGLTPRESDIVRAIGDAMTNRDIALHFGISEYTVKHHLTKIFDKVGVDSRLELAMFAKHHGLVPADAVA
jgi:two-component system, NarL family, nitrate/nitrite response regulator NarL